MDECPQEPKREALDSDDKWPPEGWFVNTLRGQLQLKDDANAAHIYQTPSEIKRLIDNGRKYISEPIQVEFYDKEEGDDEDDAICVLTRSVDGVWDDNTILARDRKYYCVASNLRSTSSFRTYPVRCEIKWEASLEQRLRHAVQKMLDTVRLEQDHSGGDYRDYWLQLRGEAKANFSVVLKGLGIENKDVLNKVCSHVKFFGTLFDEQLQFGEKMHGFDDLPKPLLEDIEAFERMRTDLYEKFNQVLVDRIVTDILKP